MEYQKSVIFIKNAFLSQKIKNFIFVRNVLFRLRNKKMKIASHSDHPLKGHVRFCLSHFGPLYCLIQFALEYTNLF